jgi:cell fate regulator YaaT (PSP1 superfamily)
METSSYLLNYGRTAELGRFEFEDSLSWCRGDRLVINSRRGLELGVVLRPAPTPKSGVSPLPRSGTILRLATSEDESQSAQLQARSQLLFTDSRRLAQALDLPMEVVDTEILLDGQQAFLHYLARAYFDPRPLIEQLLARHEFLIRLNNLVEPEEAACGACGAGEGSGGCGNCGAGGCGSCDSGTGESGRRISLA